VSWDQRFAEPIVLDDGSKLFLREAIAHLGKIIPKSERGASGGALVDAGG